MTQPGLVGWEAKFAGKLLEKFSLLGKIAKKRRLPSVSVFPVLYVTLGTAEDEEKQPAGKANHRERRSGERMKPGSVVTLLSH